MPPRTGAQRVPDSLGGFVFAGDEDGSHGVDEWPLAVKLLRAGGLPASPAAVARPRSTKEVVQVVRWAAEEGLHVVPWGAGSSVTGGATPDDGALVVDLRSLDRVLEIDTENGQVKAEAGVLGGDLEQALGEQGFTTWFSPQSLYRSTIGGWVATGATGQFSSRFGGIEDSVVALTVVLADGREVRLGTPPRGAVGPDLKRLFVGSEGALGIITEVTLRIARITPLSGVSAFALPSVDAGLGVLRETMQQGLRPLVLRLYDEDEARHLVGVPPDALVLLAAFTGIPEVAAAEEAAFRGIVDSTGGEDIGPAPTEAWLAGRYDFSRIEALLASPGGYAETIEIAGSWREMPRIHRAMKEALAPLADEVLGHFSHTYSNGTSLYLIVLGRAADDGKAVERLQQVWSTAMETALASNAVISHHHGLGRARIDYLARQLGEGVHVLDAMKNALDPCSLLHPGILAPVPSRTP